MTDQEIVLITGGNTGLGFETVRALYSSQKAYSIILAGRSLAKVDEAIKAAQAEFPSSHSKLSPLQVDIEQDESITKAFEQVQAMFGRLDILINNAGAQMDQLVAAGKLSQREMWNASWNVNTTGTHIMTSTFIPLLLKSSNPRLLFITSGTSTLAGTENMALPVNKYPPKGWPKSGFSIPAYRSSKTGMNMMMREWHRTLHEDGVKVWAVSPGFLATGLGAGKEFNAKMGAKDPADAGEFIKTVVEGARNRDVGKLVMAGGAVQPW